MAGWKRILFPTDFSDTAAHALHYAVSLARKFGGTIDVVHVLAMHEADANRAESEFPGAVPDAYQEVVASRIAVRAVSPEVGILEAAKERDSDIIVLATHGRRGLRHVLLGSVAERVVQNSPVPVLTVRSPGHTFQAL